MERIRAALTAARPGGRRDVRAQRRGLRGAAAPPRRRDPPLRRAGPRRAAQLVTDHDAFGYFAHRYGIRVVGAVIPSQTTQGQPSAGDVARLSAVIRREGVEAVFPESSVNPALARAIARQTGAVGGPHALRRHARARRARAGATYLGMEQANADAMVRGFTGGAAGCRIPGL